MRVPEAKQKAFEIAAGLIEAMDTAKFWGDELHDEAINDDSGYQMEALDLARANVVTVLRLRAK